LLALLLDPLVSFAVWSPWSPPGTCPPPALYLGHQTIHDLEHLSFILSGLLVWMQIIDPARRRRLRVSQRFGYMLALVAGGAALAGVLLFSSTPLYPFYAAQDERLFGVSPLRDQQLAES
jgi:cytochrome c oxidase assembly factor CtaG